MTTLLKNAARVFGSKDGLNMTTADILIKDGVIAQVSEKITDSADKIIDCTGLCVMPGICDMHVHLRDPGQTHKEDLISGTNAAAAGGVTAVVCMPNTTPVSDTPELIRDVVTRARECKVKVYPCAAITKGLSGEKLTDFAALKAAGAVAVSDDGMPVADTELMEQAMLAANKVELPIISHCEPENEITERELALAEKLNVPIHIAHVSTRQAVEYVRAAKSRGVAVTCEAAPHHFTLTDSELEKQDADYKMNPPLRKFEDVKAVIEGIRDGTVDCIASDHAPHTSAEKSDFEKAPNGVLGLETILGVSLRRLYHEYDIPLGRIIELLCVNPRRILGIGGGSLEIGEVADLAVVDLEEEWVVEPAELHSKSQNTCFKGMTLKGRVKYTLVEGEVVYDGN
jgi:dihydroorotase